MFRRSPAPRSTALIPTVLALALAVGWAWRERTFAEDAKAKLESTTIGIDSVPMATYTDEGKPVGKIGVYFDAPTSQCSTLVTGQFIIDPGKTPHAPHVHPEEEVLIVASGHGEIFCDGKTTPVGPGSVMFSAPNVAHGITNTGAEPLTFYFMKWLPKKAG